MQRVFLRALLALLSTAVLSLRVDASADRVPTLARWYQAVGNPRPGEGFGPFLSRVALARVDTPYGQAPENAVAEVLAIELDRFECVSLLESSLAVGRCAWRAEPTRECFVWEVLGLRYRSGLMSNYASRLHYFVDWLEDNERRWRLEDMTAELGGKPVRREFSFITRRARRVPALAAPDVQQSMAAIEAHLSSRQYSVLGRNDIGTALYALQDGDLVAVVGDKPGRLITHVGLVVRRPDGRARLLHASSYHRRVVVSREDIAAYVARRPERTGIMVARPLPPRKTH